MIDFVYDEIVAKRKQALRTMAELCRNFTSDENFREAILAYLQDSEFTPILKRWVNRPFEQIGLDVIDGVLVQIETLEEAKRLVGTARRMLDEDPDNIALRFVSSCARLRSSAEGDESVRQEYTVLLRQLGRNLQEEYIEVMLRLLDEVKAQRKGLCDDVLGRTLHLAGNGPFVRCYLQRQGCWPESPEHHAAMIQLLAADDLRRLNGLRFYDGLVPEKSYKTNRITQ